MTQSNKGSADVCYQQAKESDYEEMALLGDAEGWDTKPEDIQHLCSILPSAAHVAHSGGETVGLYSIIFE